MTKLYKSIFHVACLLSIFLWMGCSDDFLKDKKNYSNLTPDIYNDYAGASLRVQDIYLRLLPDVNNGLSYRSTSSGKADIQSQSTEEFSGLSNFVSPDVILSTSSGLNDWFHVNKATNAGPWGEIRNCNDVLEGVSGSTLTDTQKKTLLGQVYFFRAWQYYLLVKTYGGVPIVDHVQVTDVSQAQALEVPRSTTKQCIDFICQGLDTAASMLPARWDDANFGRVTKGAALALAGRARLLYASPLFNRADNADRWQAAYDANKKAIDALTAGGFGLAYKDAPGINGAGWAKIFSDFNSNEAVFVTLYNKVHDDNAANEIYRNNHWEQTIRPANTNKNGGGMSPTSMMVDLFPMADGKKPTEVGTYNPLTFFANRDPRFYRTFGFPGVSWRFDAASDPTSLGVDYPYSGANYMLWNYSWYANSTKQADITQSGYGADGLGLNYKGVYIRKRSDDFDMTTPIPTLLYRWSLENKQGPFGEGAMPWMEIRYAEVLLNFAEAACGAGHPDEAIQALKDIRKRASLPAGTDGLYGLSSDLASDRGKLFGAILYERQIELAYEGKRFDDMRRWLLWDGGAAFNQIAGVPTSWTLTGFGGNTCTYLGVEPLNGKRRDNIEITAKATAEEAQGKDPIKTNRPAAMDLKTDLSTQTNALVTFYTTYLMRKTRQGDEAGKVVSFKPQYYFIGLTSGAQTNNVTLLQTIGWADVLHGNINGTFDPLAE
ncbi:RagB/SusD family nutrient uptake outer membrane protein [Parabacteroides sp. FAFU027]|uniref:RagB/SusD family nutrient uptake outer membrane protein n=1 Tax=Parabacteroides sp. FAFU027 TaxID=2922715 RepID=UPI001FB02207|nr:RagB/SusD family nutrient uptake outer membrane protein [Parabacteroides sp. FAFU027]